MKGKKSQNLKLWNTGIWKTKNIDFGSLGHADHIGEHQKLKNLDVDVENDDLNFGNAFSYRTKSH